MLDAELAVVGAGPAGLATAIGVRHRGLHVVVIDAAHPPIDKACGEGLLPEAIQAASRLGLELPLDTASRSSSIEGLRFLRNGRTLESRFRGPAGQAFRRTELSRALLDQAARMGVEFRWGVTVTGIRGNQLETSIGVFTAGWIAAADGERSRLRQLLSLDRPPATTRYAFRQHFACEPWTRLVEVYWGSRCQAYATPLDGQVGIAVISSDPSQRIQAVLQGFPELRQRLRGAPPTSTERGAATTLRHLPQVVHGSVALVGDASGSVDAITGEGIGLGFLQAGLLCRAIEKADLGLYQAGHSALTRRARWLSRGLLVLDKNPTFAGLAMGVLADHPRWFEHLVELHTTPVNINIY
jgi:menaquinone-9 beta-reductase